MSDMIKIAVDARPLPKPITCPSFTFFKASKDNALMASSNDINRPLLVRFLTWWP